MIEKEEVFIFFGRRELGKKEEVARQVCLMFPLTSMLLICLPLLFFFIGFYYPCQFRIEVIEAQFWLALFHIDCFSFESVGVRFFIYLFILFLSIFVCLFYVLFLLQTHLSSSSYPLPISSSEPTPNSVLLTVKMMFKRIVSHAKSGVKLKAFEGKFLVRRQRSVS